MNLSDQNTQSYAEAVKKIPEVRHIIMRREAVLIPLIGLGLRYYNSPGEEQLVIDFHGLCQLETGHEIGEAVISVRKSRHARLEVIVGQGHHSPHGPKLMLVVLEFAEAQGIRHEIDLDSPGRISLFLDEKDLFSPLSAAWLLRRSTYNSSAHLLDSY